MKEKLGTVVIDGKLIDLDKTSVEELKKMQADLKKKEENIRKQIESIIDER